MVGGRGMVPCRTAGESSRKDGMAVVVTGVVGYLCCFFGDVV